METRDLEQAAEASSEEIQPPTLTRKTGKSCTYGYIKRVQDIVLSALALLLLSPLMLLLALAVVIDDPKGGPIFSQVRCGRGGEAFRLYKFRTMCVDAEKRLEKLLPYNEMTGPAFKIQNDPRITRLGRFLRSTGLDELPQLVNILKGDMSIVGPRPPQRRTPAAAVSRCAGAPRQTPTPVGGHPRAHLLLAGEPQPQQPEL